MNLVIVESPTKAKTIGKFLGAGYDIRASMGHLVDLPSKKLSVDIEHNFEPDFEPVEDKKKTIAELKSAAKKADSIILATDPDREGEAIAYHVAQLLSTKNPESLKRIVFHEITKEAIEEALSHPRSIDKYLVDAQIARRVLDRLVGYKLSPILWQKVRRGLSAGRVQSVALRVIVEREREIEKFKKKEYWTISSNLNRADKGNEGALFELVEIDGKTLEQKEKFNLYDGEYTSTFSLVTQEKQAKEIADDLKTKKFEVSDVLQKETKRSPAPPFTTSTLQQQAAARLFFTAKKTMTVAQKLYEEGLITYHRTDSVILSQSATTALRGYAEKTFGAKYIPQSPRFYKTKQKLAQEAHEAIRPTKAIPGLGGELGRDHARLYDLIFKRAVASQMSDAVIESTTVQVHSSEKKYTLKANGSVLQFEGFLKINPQALEDRRLPQFIKEEVLSCESSTEEKHETTPPPRYNDASLIKTLEEKGIGRPSTYASIITTIEVRRYVEKQEGRFVPTSVGMAVNDFLVANFSEIDDIPFTAEMEDELDNIVHQKKDWHPMIKSFYSRFEERLGDVKEAKRVKIEVEETDEKCETCGAPMVVRIGKFGKFLSCSKFPECKFSKPFVEDTHLLCPKDGGKVVVRKTRKGRTFYGCSNWPKCEFAAWNLKDIAKPAETPATTATQEVQATS